MLNVRPELYLDSAEEEIKWNEFYGKKIFSDPFATTDTKLRCIDIWCTSTSSTMATATSTYSKNIYYNIIVVLHNITRWGGEKSYVEWGEERER